MIYKYVYMRYIYMNKYIQLTELLLLLIVVDRGNGDDDNNGREDGYPLQPAQGLLLDENLVASQHVSLHVSFTNTYL